MRARLSNVAPEESREAGETAARRLVASEVWAQVTGVLVFSPVRGEIDATPVARAAWATGRRVFLPSPRPETLELRPVEWAEGARLRPGPYGIPVVADSVFGAGVEGAIDLVLVPGLAFDGRGARLGSGLGYYDRFLAAHPSSLSLGLGYTWQVVDAVPEEGHDVRLWGLLTSDGLSRARASNGLP
jgi:5-formyltetrahydrofolate cyclo-ligase